MEFAGLPWPYFYLNRFRNLEGLTLKEKEKHCCKEKL